MEGKLDDKSYETKMILLKELNGWDKLEVEKRNKEGGRLRTTCIKKQLA